MERESARIAVTEMNIPMPVEEFQKEFRTLAHSFFAKHGAPLMPGITLLGFSLCLIFPIFLCLHLNTSEGGFFQKKSIRRIQSNHCTTKIRLEVLHCLIVYFGMFCNFLVGRLQLAELLAKIPQKSEIGHELWNIELHGKLLFTLLLAGSITDTLYCFNIRISTHCFLLQVYFGLYN